MTVTGWSSLWKAQLKHRAYGSMMTPLGNCLVL